MHTLLRKKIIGNDIHVFEMVNLTAEPPKKNEESKREDTGDNISKDRRKYEILRESTT